MDVRQLKFIGILTWLLVGVPSLIWQQQHGGLLTTRGLIFIASYACFGLLFSLAAREGCSMTTRVLLALAEAAFAMICISVQRTGLVPVLLVVLAGQLGTLSLKASVPWITLQSAALWFLIPDGDAAWAAFAYFTFQLLAMFSVRIAHRESKGRQELAAANAELQVAAGLLDIGSRAEERLRIARDLHDVMGHHLTALSLNLEVASHHVEGAACEHIAKAQALTRTLLTDVREVVSRLRDSDPVDLAAALHALQNVIEKPALHIDVRESPAITDPAVAQAALRAIQEIVTNAVRHSGARNLSLRLATQDRALAITARDDGNGTDHVSFGNGLRGMRERVEQSHGSMEVESERGRGFEVRIRLPLESQS
jgi:signal transduction histidine kinase